MPQFKVKVKVGGLTEQVTVIAENQREANRKAVKLATQLLGTSAELI